MTTQRGYYDNTLVIGGLRIAATHHEKHGWGWFFEDTERAPVKDWQVLKNIRTLEDEVRAALPPGWLEARERAAAKREEARRIETEWKDRVAALRAEADEIERAALH
jgi:hypothetical protein